MSLPVQVQLPVQAASQAMREALAFSARSESPILIAAITDILAKIDSLQYMDIMLNDLEQQLKMVKNVRPEKD